MNIDPHGKSELEARLRGMYPTEPLLRAEIHESGQTATVQVADLYLRYRLSETAKRVLQGQETVLTVLDVAQFFTLIEQTK